MSRRSLVIAGAGLLAFAAGSALLTRVPTTRGAAATTVPTTAPSTPPTPAPVHITPRGEWMNDVQRPIRLDGRWHLYNLVNADHPQGNGTSWRHFTSDDLVRWHDEGIAIEKYRDALGDIETGSTVVDIHGTAGFGPGAVIAVVTQQADGIQQQSLFGSVDGGWRFVPHPGNPIMPNPGAPDWRDPKVVRDVDAGRWVMALAEGRRIGFYTSDDLLSWTYRSDFARDDLGTLECPDLFRMRVDGDPARERWVLAASANGARYGRADGVVYWIGSWDGERFAADDGPDAAPRWLDDGPDYYAGVTWSDESTPEQLNTRYAIGWMSGWAYARDIRLPRGGTGGPDSIVRVLRLTSTPSGDVLRVAPIDAVRALESRALRAEAQAVSELSPLVDADAPCRLRVTIDAGDAREARLGLPGGAVVTWVRDRDTLVVTRDGDAHAAAMPAAYREPAEMPVPPGARLDLDLIVGESTIEVFCGGRALSMLTPCRGGQVSVEAAGGSIRRIVATSSALR